MERFQKSILPLVPSGHNPLKIAHAERERSLSTRFGEVFFIIIALREVDGISGFVQQLNIETSGCSTILANNGALVAEFDHA
jgi:hypothetical protein